MGNRCGILMDCFFGANGNKNNLLCPQRSPLPPLYGLFYFRGRIWRFVFFFRQDVTATAKSCKPPYVARNRE